MTARRMVSEISEEADTMSLGKNLYELRRQRGMTQEEFAENLNVSRQAVQKWEAGVSPS